MREELFKNKIPFYSIMDELITNYFHKIYDTGYDTGNVLYASYRTNSIHEPIKLGISNYKDLMVKVNPLLYYLASKYKDMEEWV